jgi:hypothetical protein
MPGRAARVRVTDRVCRSYRLANAARNPARCSAVLRWPARIPCGLGTGRPSRPLHRGAKLGGPELGSPELGSGKLGNGEPGNGEPGSGKPGSAEPRGKLGGSELGGAELDAELGTGELGGGKPDGELGTAELASGKLGGSELGGAELGGAELDAELGTGELGGGELGGGADAEAATMDANATGWAAACDRGVPRRRMRRHRSLTNRIPGGPTGTARAGSSAGACRYTAPSTSSNPSGEANAGPRVARIGAPRRSAVRWRTAGSPPRSATSRTGRPARSGQASSRAARSAGVSGSSPTR